MELRIVSQFLSIQAAADLQRHLTALMPYAAQRDAEEAVVHVDMQRYRFPAQKIPAHDADYSGFLTHSSADPDKEAFIFCFREGTLLFGMQHEKDGTYNVYIHDSASISCRTAIQYILLLEGCRSNLLGVHAVTLEHHGRGVMFSAPSGTGKTTHTELWRREFGAHILNGDFAMLKCRDDAVIFDGTPFCGSSPYAERGQWPVTDIVFLRQAPENSIRRATRIEAITNAMENCFMPTWDKARTQMCMNMIGTLLKQVRVWILACNMDPEAAHVARQAITAAQQGGN